MKTWIYRKSLTDIIHSSRKIIECRDKINGIHDKLKEIHGSPIYFVDGMTSDIIYELEKIELLEYKKIRRSIIRSIFNLR